MIKKINNLSRLKKNNNKDQWKIRARQSLNYGFFLLLFFAVGCNSASPETSPTLAINSNDFRLSTTSVTKMLGYTDNTYGDIELNDGVTANFSIIGNAPVSVNNDGMITVNSGAGVGTYTFQVQIAGTGSYEGSTTTGTLTLIISNTTNIITENDFTVSTTSVTKVLDYTNINYGKIELNAGVTATFAITSSTTPANAITISSDGTISVATGIGLGTYTFEVEVTGTENYSGRIIINLTFNVVYPPLYYVSSFSDNDRINLAGAGDITKAEVNGTTYFFVAADDDDAINGFEVRADGQLNLVTSISDADNPDYELDFVWDMVTTEVDGVHYLFAAGANDNGISMFEIEDGGTLRNITNVTDNDTLALEFAWELAIAQVGGTTYLFVAGAFDSGISTFEIGSGGILRNVTNIFDDLTLNLLNVSDITTVAVNGVTYLLAIGTGEESGISVFEIKADGTLTYVDNVNDTEDPNYLLKQPWGALATAVINNTTYVFITGYNENGVTSFALEAGGQLRYVDSVRDDIQLENAINVYTAVVNGKNYLFVASYTADGRISMLEIANDGTLTKVTDLASSDLPASFYRPRGLVTTELNGVTYLLVPAAGTGGNNPVDSEVNVFRVTSR